MINGTGPGGAERMLGRVLQQMDRSQFELSVISLNEFGLVGEELQELGIPVHALNMLRKRIPKAVVFGKIVRLLRAKQPDLVQTWMYLSDLFGGLAAKIAGRTPVIWNIRHSTLDPRFDSRNMILTARICGLLSRWLPAKIVLNSEAAKPVHARVGFSADKMEVIPNGFDLQEFRPSRKSRAAIRGELGFDDNVQLVGLVGRFHPHKDHRNFIAAAAIVAAQLPRTRFLLAGGEHVLKRSDIDADIVSHGLKDRIHWLGRRGDVAAVNCSLDVAVCSSVTEGFPNVVGEAMACGVPCVSTDVGESAAVVGPTGRIVPIQDPHALANGILELLNLPPESRAELGHAARQRIADRYDIRRIATRYAELWTEVGSTSKAVRRSDPSIQDRKAA